MLQNTKGKGQPNYGLMKLGKKSNVEQLTLYFQKIRELQKTGEKYPVNLDEVWPLVYTLKKTASDVLESDFIEGEDYIKDSLLWNLGKQKKGSGGHNKKEYKMSVSCLEYLIVRKQRLVFNVYRTVFHKTTDFLELLNTPVHGILPIYSDGKIGFPRKELLQSCGRSFKNGYRLRYRFSEDCFNIGRTACVSAKLAKLLVAQYNVRQMELDFVNALIEGGDHE